MSVYVPIIGLMVLGGGFIGVSIILSKFVGPSRFNRAKYEAYECGLEATPAPEGGGRIPIKYYITAMLFIVFDIEIVFLYPWAVSFHDMSQTSAGTVALFGLVEMFLFIVTVFIAYIYVVRRGGLTWD
ncbi:MAG: NADH-quinone oxidoreductase subunit A [Propionibacteriaceae bacterium]|jgi:NADH-quinone oxidoreductase subunit A|nr:NADH-quinone oxidoreductase subunit A [Propionibacteriaceae bacterium]